MKKNIIYFILGGIVFSCVSVYATIIYTASQVRYTKSNNQEVTLDSALDELYTNSNNLASDLNTANSNLSTCTNSYSTCQNNLSS